MYLLFYRYNIVLFICYYRGTCFKYVSFLDNLFYFVENFFKMKIFFFVFWNRMLKLFFFFLDGLGYFCEFVDMFLGVVNLWMWECLFIKLSCFRCLCFFIYLFWFLWIFFFYRFLWFFYICWSILYIVVFYSYLEGFIFFLCCKKYFKNVIFLKIVGEIGLIIFNLG